MVELEQVDHQAVQPGRPALLAGVALLLVVVPFGLLLLLVELRWPPLVALDEAVRDGLYQFARGEPLVVDVLRVVSALGTVGAYAVVLAVLAGWLLRCGGRAAAAFVVLTPLGGVLLNTSVKALVDRARPQLPEPLAVAAHSSFPSGHAQGVVVGVGVLLLVLLPRLQPGGRRAAALLGGSWVLLMGFSRLVLGVHYLSDVLAGYVLGLAWLALCCGVGARGGLPLGGRRGSAQPRLLGSGSPGG